MARSFSIESAGGRKIFGWHYGTYLQQCEMKGIIGPNCEFCSMVIGCCLETVNMHLYDRAYVHMTV